jgi:hypothetical protein
MQMTNSEILKSAHKQAREFRRLYPSYREAFADFLRTIYADLRNPPAPVVTGFQVVEPWYKRTMYVPATGERVTL